MRRKRLIALALAGALVAGGAGVAVGATASDEARQAEQRVLGDAASRLGTSPEKLREALRAAQDAQLDRAVRAGELTREQADRIKEHRSDTGLVLGGPGGPHGFRGGPGHGFGHRGGFLRLGESLAKALGLTQAQLRAQFEDGKTVAEIADAEGRTLAQVRSALRADARERLADEVRDGDLTQAQADEALEHLDEHLERIGELGGDRGGFRGRHGFRGP